MEMAGTQISDLSGSMQSMSLSGVNVNVPDMKLASFNAKKLQSDIRVSKSMYDDRPINASGSYNLSNVPLDEIEIQEDFDEVDNADDQDWDLLESIMGRYTQILTDEIEVKSQSSL